MRPIVLVVGLVMALSATAAASVQDDVDAALAQVAKLEMMKAGRTYSLPARGEATTGRIEDFLCRRELDEILSSGLSTGCGDHAAAFYGLLRAKGISLRYIQVVELSAASLLDGFSGHTAVAVKDPQTDRWILVDPTNNKVLSKEWDSSSQIFHSPAGRFWIGYIGRLEDYPVKTPAQLKTSFRRMLRMVPAADWDHEVVRLDFNSTASMFRADGSFVNSRYSAFLERYSQVYDDLGLQPEKWVTVEFADGGPGWQGDCKRTRADAWKCSVGRESAMNQQWFTWVERYVMRQLNEPPH
ncbi:MAG: hypothetical protein COV48_04605 [Elusimicrobia bacterium CG11_big_fil_rev_8_21_14_0_20_64_6]|nr:MAG: hypothetical protein COV48_04605 [Elusimicrobia bacterium CG11_big_fil_rev_8_21_14_0_20_64_6]